MQEGSRDTEATRTPPGGNQEVWEAIRNAMKFYPYYYQLQDVRKIHRLKGRALLAWEPGLGKTGTSLLYLHRHPEIRPVVVICPSSVKWWWEHEAKRFFGMRSEVLEGYCSRRDGLHSQAPLTILNYGILHDRRSKKKTHKGWLSWLLKLRPKMVILDECGSNIQSLNTSTTRAVIRLCKDVPHVLALSGTPLVNRPMELWPTLHILRPDIYNQFFQYGINFCSGKRGFFGWDFRGSSNLDLLHEQLLQTCMIRRRKVDVLKDLPEKTHSVIPLHLSSEDWKEYVEARDNFITWLLKNAPPGRVSRAMKAERLVQAGYLLRLVAEKKLPLALELVDNFLENSEQKIILFANHREILERVSERYGKQAVLIHGEVPTKQRKILVRKFQEHKGVRIFAGNIRAAGTGLNLDAASNVDFLEIDWTPGAMIQAANRPHRLTQKNSVTIRYYVAQGTIEEKLLEVVQRKQGVINEVLDGGEQAEDFDVWDQLCEYLVKERKP